MAIDGKYAAFRASLRMKCHSSWPYRKSSHRRRADFSEEFPEDGEGGEIEDRDQEDRGDGPCLDAVEGGHAEIAAELGGVVLEAGEELRDGEADGRDAVEVLAEVDEDQDEGEVKRVGEGFEKMEDGLVELEEISGDEADERGGSHDGEDAESLR